MSEPPLSFPCICARLRRTTRRVSQIYDRHLEPHGLTISQFGVMAQVRLGDAPSIGQLAERMVMDPTTLTRALKPLERRGLLTLTPDPADRRTRRLALTEEGRALLRTARPGGRRRRPSCAPHSARRRASPSSPSSTARSRASAPPSRPHHDDCRIHPPAPRSLTP